MKNVLCVLALLLFMACSKEDVIPNLSDSPRNLTGDTAKFSSPVIDLYEEWVNITGNSINRYYKHCDQANPNDSRILFFYPVHYGYNKVGGCPLFIYNRGVNINVRVQEYSPGETAPYFSAFIYRLHGSGTYYRMIIQYENPVGFIEDGYKFKIETRSGLITHTGQTTFLPLIN